MRAVLLLFAAVAALFAATNSSRDGCKQCQKEREAYCKSYPAASTCQSLDNCGFVFTNVSKKCDFCHGEMVYRALTLRATVSLAITVRYHLLRFVLFAWMSLCVHATCTYF